MALLIKDLLQSIIYHNKNWKTDLLCKWYDIIGSLHNKVRIEKIYDDSIVIGVFHSCWMQELYFLSPLLIKTINEKLDQPRIKQIRFTHIGVKKKVSKKITPHSFKKKMEIQLTQEDERILAKINDPTLRNILKEFRIRCYQEQ